MRDELKAYADAVRIEHGLNFSVRMGINSGEVVVGRIGDDLRMDYTAQGHTVGLAQRMAALAEAGKALIAGTTIDLVQGYFALRDLGAMNVKGIERPVRVADRRRRVKININTVSWLLADTFCRRVVPADIRTWGTARLDRSCGGSSALAEGTSSPWKTGWPIDLDLCSPVGWYVVRYKALRNFDLGVR